MISSDPSSTYGRPVLRADAVLRVVARDLEIEIDDVIYTVSGLDPTLLREALALLNGVLDLPAVSRQSGLSLTAVQGVVDHLARSGALGFQSDAMEPMDPAAFARLCRERYGPWKARLFSHPLWTGLVEGSLARSVFVGWAVESYWFIEGVLDRLPMAIACCENRGIRAVFTQHFAEEWDHFHFFARTLDSLGVTAEQRAVGRPLPATRAIQDLMRASARRDPLRYAACSGFLESTGNDRTAARSFFDHVAAHYDGSGREAVGPMAAHVDLDEGYGHSSCVEKVANVELVIRGDRARAALQDAYGLVETLEMWSTDILRHYASPSALPLASIRAYRAMEP